MRSYTSKIILGLMVAALLASCGKGPGTEKISYVETADQLKALSADMSAEMSQQDAKRYLAQVKRLLEKQIISAGEDELIIVPVNVAEVQSLTIQEKINYLGNMEGYPSVKVYPKMSDIMKKVYVKNGDFVQKGDVLAKISDMTVRSSVLQAEAGLASAKAQLANLDVEYERLKSLYEQKAVSESQWDQMATQKKVAEYGVKQAAAAYEMSQTQLGFTEITAPITGYVSDLMYEEGGMATPQMAFASIHNVDTLSVKVSITDADLARAHVDQKALITVNTYPGVLFEGYVENISPVVNPATRTADVEILIPNKDRKLTAGMFARVAIIVGEKENVLVIDKAIADTQTERVQNGGGMRDAVTVKTYSCYVVKNDVANRVNLTTGIESETQIEVISGLEAGDLLVTMGQNNLSDSSMVRIVK